jgi:hypothetical protein
VQPVGALGRRPEPKLTIPPADTDPPDGRNVTADPDCETRTGPEATETVWRWPALAR